MDDHPTLVGAELLDDCEWPSVPQKLNRRSCWDYSEQYYILAKDTSASGRCGVVYELLSKVTALDFEVQPHRPALGPQHVLDSIHKDDISALAERAPLLDDPELRARLYDLSWIVNRDYKSARRAVDDYIRSAEPLGEQDDWRMVEKRVSRALDLASSINDGDGRNRVVQHINSILDAYTPDSEYKFLAAHLMRILLKHKLGAPDNLSSLSLRIAEYAESEARWDRARSHWNLKAQWDELRGSHADAALAKNKAAETHVAEAEGAVAGSSPNYMLAASVLLDAVELLRRLGNRTRADEIYKRALECQALARRQASPLPNIGLDVTEYVRLADKAVKNKPLREALLTLAVICEPPAVEWLTELTNDILEAAPIQHLMQAVATDHRGRSVAKRPPHLSGLDDQEAIAIRASMLEHAETVRAQLVLAHIEPARRRILLDHRPNIEDVLELVMEAAFVPNGRAIIFARALHAGLTGDFLVAGHLIPAQLENSIRFVLDQRGVLTSSISARGIQEDLDLNELFNERNRSNLVTVFGEDLTLDLEGPLIARWGANLRNRIYHGLVHEHEFSNLQVVYLWWVTLRLCLWNLLFERPAGGRLGLTPLSNKGRTDKVSPISVYHAQNPWY